MSALQDLIDNDSHGNKCTNSSYLQKIAAATAKVLLSLYSVTSSLHGSLHLSLKVINKNFYFYKQSIFLQLSLTTYFLNLQFSFHYRSQVKN